MSEPKKVYKFVFVYNPFENTVRELYIFNGRTERVDECIKKLSSEIDVRKEIILGKSILGNFYQLYLEKYAGGSQYIREDVASVHKFMNPSRIGVALSDYINKYNLWKLIKD